MKLKNHVFILIINLIININSLYCQIDSTKIHRWSMSFELAPNYEHWIVHILSHSQKHDTSNIQFVEGLTPRIGLNASTLVSYKMIKNCYLQTGIVFDNMGYKTASTTVYSYTQNGKIISSSTYWEKVHHTYIGIPILITGKFNVAKKIKVSADLGATYYFLAISQNRWEGSESQHSTDTGLFSGISVNLNFGLHYLITNRHFVYLEPFYNYLITSDDDGSNGTYKLNFYSYGVKVGIGFGLGKKKQM